MMRASRLVVRWAWMAAALAVCGEVQAQWTADGMEDARRRGKLLAGVKQDFPPFGYVNAEGDLVGFDVEIAAYLAKALFREAGRLEPVPVTSGSRIPFLYRGWIDLIVATLTVTDARSHVLQFSDPYFVSGSMLLVQEESAVSGLEDLGGRQVGVVKGSVQVEDLQQIAPDARQVRYDTVTQAVDALRRGEVDAVAQDDVLVLQLANQHEEEFKAVGPSFLPRPYAIAVRKGDVKFIQWVNRQLSAMENDGTYDALRSKYFGAIENELIEP